MFINIYYLLLLNDYFNKIQSLYLSKKKKSKKNLRIIFNKYGKDTKYLSFFFYIYESIRATTRREN